MHTDAGQHYRGELPVSQMPPPQKKIRFVGPRNPVAVGMAVTSHPPHRPVLAALPHTVLTSDMPPYGGWRESAHREMHEQRVVRVASDRRVAPAFPRWAAVGCAVP